jgi:cysteine desulfurase
VLDAVHWLADHEGAVVEWLPVDPYGRVHPEPLRAALERDPDDVALVTVMWANNEVGTLLPIPDLAAVCAEFGVPMHSDAVEAFGQAELDFAASGLAAMTVTGHKVGGPYGVGALLLRREDTTVPLLHGGEQERSRSGTLDVPAVAAFATAGALAARRRERYVAEVGALRDALVRGVRAEVPDAVLNGDPAPGGRLASHAHFTFPGCEGDALLLLLDAQGIACSTGSACTAGVAQPSHVLLATGTDPDLARGTLRFSLGHTSTAADVEAVAKAIGPAVERARTAGLT